MASCHLPPAGFRGVYRDDPLARAVYSEAAGIGRIVPAAVAVPADAEDVVTLVQWAADRSLPLVPRGSGSSMAGGAIGPGVIVDLSRLNYIGDVDPSAHWIRAGAGALRGDVNRAALARGLRFPVDPSSGEFCTVGGMAATNAAGSHSLRFGPTRDWVVALDCVFADGTRVEVSRLHPLPHRVPAIDAFIEDVVPTLAAAPCDRLFHRGVAKDSSGYGVGAYATSGKLIELLVGSEGTLAIIVGVQLALAPIPHAASSVLGAFASLDEAVAAAGKAREARAVACELLDRTFLDVAALGDVHSQVAALASIPPRTEAILLAEMEEANEEAARFSADELADSFAEAGATLTRVALGQTDQHELWELRHAASPILSRLDPSLRSMQFIEDSAVPPERLADYVRGVRAALGKRGMRGVIFGHAGDAHVHVNPLVNVSKPGWREDVAALFDDIVSLTAELGGTLAGEHGDGRIRTPLLARVWPPEALGLFAAVKAAFDPKGILNPGVKVPLERQKPLNDIKYDPTLPPLPAIARDALARISAEKAYATPRLSLLTKTD